MKLSSSYQKVTYISFYQLVSNYQLYSKELFVNTISLEFPLWLEIIKFLKFLDAESVNYYWKNFNGDIPSDAVSGGEQIYIGLGLGNNNLDYGLIPTTIRKGDIEVRIPLDNEAKVSHVPKVSNCYDFYTNQVCFVTEINKTELNRDET